MSKTIKRRAHQVFSTVVAVSLALLMVPIVPGVAQKAEAATTSSFPVYEVSGGLIKGMVYDQYGDNEAATQDVDPDALAEAAKSSLTFPTVDATIEASVKDDATTDASSKAASLAAYSAESASDADVATKTNSDVKDATEKWVVDNEGEKKLADEAKKQVADTLGAGNYEVGSIEVTPTADPISYGESSNPGEVVLKATGAQAKEGSAQVRDGSVALVANSIGFSASNLQLSGISNETADVIELAGELASASEFTVKALKDGTGKVKYSFGYDSVVSGYQYNYTADYVAQYTGFEYEGWTYSGKFTYTYKDAGGNEQTGANPIEVELAGPKVTKTYDSPAEVSDANATTAAPVSVSDKSIATGKSDTADYEQVITVAKLFPEPLTAANADYTASGSELQFGSPEEFDPFSAAAEVSFGGSQKAAALKKLSLVVQDDTQAGLENLAVEWNETAQKVKVTPKKAADSAVTVNFALEYGEGAGKLIVPCSVTACVVPLEIDLSDFSLADKDFASADTLKASIVAEVNGEIKDRVNAVNATAGAEVVSAPYYTVDDVSLDDFDPAQNNEEQDCTVTYSTAFTAPDDYANFLILNPPADYKVKAMESYKWSDSAASGLVLKTTVGSTAVDLTDANKGTWVNSVPTPQWADHSLRYGAFSSDSADFGGDNARLDGADGTHSLSLFVLDEAGKIFQVTDISYKLDRTAPSFLAATYKGKDVVGGETLVGDGSVTVDLDIVDPGASDAVPTGSGLKSVSASYSDTESGSAKTPQLNTSGTTYSFVIGNNEDVRTDSIKVSVSDVAGNAWDKTAPDAQRVDKAILRLLADADSPQVRVSWDNNDARNGSYFNANRTMIVTVEDVFFNYIQQYQSDQEILTVKQNGQVVIAVHPGDFAPVGQNPNLWTYSLAFTSDADWEVSSIHVEDLVGHVGTAAGASFTIDKVAPSMDVVFDNNNAANGNYYNAARTATITVNEHNFSANLINIEPTANAGNGTSVGAPVVSSWSDDGDVHTATVNFPGQGVYALSVGGTDLALNALPGYTASEFVVDTEKPQISITGVENRTASAGVMQPSVQVTDTNISDATSIQISKAPNPFGGADANPYVESRSSSATEITVSYPNPAEIVENDGVYTINVEATDMAGNTDSQALVWSVNRFGSTYVFGSDTERMLNNYLKTDDVSDVKVTEINPQSLKEDSTAVELTKDTSNSTLKVGSDYSMTESDQAGWHAYDYDISKDNFSSDGAYKVLLHSQDEAANNSENTMMGKDKSRSSDKTAAISFAVDNQKPVVSFVDLADGGTYDEVEHEAKVSIEDNLKLDHAVVTVDGKEVASFDAGELAAQSVHSFTVDGNTDGAKRMVEVKAYDAATNDISLPVEVVVTTNPVALWMANTPLFIGSIAGGAAVIGGAVAFFVFRARRVA